MVCLASLFGALALPALAQQAPDAPVASAVQGRADYALSFDAARDPAQDLQRAVAAAAASGKRVLVVVGGDWCVWCFLLDRHLGADPEAARILHGGFEVLRVYYGEDNTNDAFLARFPEFEMFPHFFVVETDGRVLASVDADVFIADAKYSTALIRAFAAGWRKH
ncbi:MAG: hypothetical protein CALGDGBN_01138 [Pseudomonadales bacterium]|nr:hypothetical protein [Pseudomonadales bacterium]